MIRKFLLVLILALTFMLRIFKVGTVPASLYGDEQAFAYNAYSIMLTGKDEYGTPFPLEFRSFNDYKAPIPVYGLVPFIKVFGLNAFAIRLPVVIASSLTVFVTYLLARRFLTIKIALLTGYLLAISPWHVHLSRGYFEATIALFFFVSAIYFFLRSTSWSSRLLSVFAFAASLYTYFTPRILVPIFLLFLIIYEFSHHRGVLLAICQRYVVLLLFLFFLALPLIYSSIFGKGFSRFAKLSESLSNQVTVAVNRERTASLLPQSVATLLHNKATVRLRMVKDNYFEHLSLNFWYIFGDNSLRYFTGNMGMFYLVELPFFVIGLWHMWHRSRRAAILFCGWILIAPIPAALVGRSFAVRSLAMLPAPFVFVAYGINVVTNLVNKLFFNSSTPGESTWLRINWPPPRCLYRLVVLGAVTFIFAGSFMFHQIKYYFEYPVYAATWWGWENKKAIDYATEREDNFDYIFLSDFYTGMPLAFAVYKEIHPDVYRNAISNPIVLADDRRLIKFGKYYIGSLDLNKQRLDLGIIPGGSLYLGRPEEADSDEVILSPDDGRTIFKVYKTN